MVMVMKNNMLPHKVFKLIKLMKRNNIRNNIFLHFFSLELKLCLFIIFLSLFFSYNFYTLKILIYQEIIFFSET